MTGAPPVEDSVPTLVVVPAYNETLSVGGVVTRLVGCGYDVLVVDDGSTDDTSHVAAEAGAAVVRLSANLGVGGALRCGFRYAVEHGYTRVVQCDADGQHDPGLIAVLLRRHDETGADMVIGSRFLGPNEAFATSTIRRAVMRRLARSATRAAGTSITDATSGFRCIAEPLLGEFARSFPTHYLGDTYEAIVVAGRNGYRICEMPATMSAREVGSSSAHPIAAAKLVVRAGLTTLVGMEFPIRPRPPDGSVDRPPLV